jgi:hypothetical protein
MALQYGYNPEYDVIGMGTYTSAVQRWLNQQKTAGAQFTAAQQPLQQSVQMFQPGGGYGAGQSALLQEQARQAQAQALSEQVASGMSSGSLATGTGLRVKRDLATGLKGVEDTRTQFLAQALQALSSLRGTQAQVTAAATEPSYAPFYEYLGQRYGQVSGLNEAAMRSAPSPTLSPVFPHEEAKRGTMKY